MTHMCQVFAQPNLLFGRKFARESNIDEYIEQLWGGSARTLDLKPPAPLPAAGAADGTRCRAGLGPI